MAAFEKAQERLHGEGIRVVGASTDPLEKAKGTVEEMSLTFPVGYGLPLKETAAALGAFYEAKRQVLHSTGFVLRPDRSIVVAQYSSGPIGRLVWQDVVSLVQILKQREK